MQAIVVFDSGRGWWFAELADGRSCFVHANDIEDNRHVHLNDRIEVGEITRPASHPNRLQAKKVKYLSRCIIRQTAAPKAVPYGDR